MDSSTPQIPFLDEWSMGARLTPGVSRCFYGDHTTTRYTFIEGVPVILRMYRLYVHDFKRTDIPFFDSYKSGVYEGFKSTFIPSFVDTPETRRELVMQEIKRWQMGFPSRSETSKDINIMPERYFDKADIYEYGVYVGKQYKAWCLVFENPTFYETEFAKLLPVAVETKDPQEQLAKDPTLATAHKEKEVRYIFRPKTNKDVTAEYRYYKGEFLEEEPGFVTLTYNGIISRIYTPELATLLCGENITLGVQGTGETVKLNRLEQDFFSKVYAKAYQEGRDKFKKEFPLTDEISYGTHTEEFAKRLHRYYYHAECLGASGGWSRLKHSYPRIITAQAINDFGLYAGMICEAEEIIIDLNLMDRGFAKCSQQNHNNTQPERESTAQTQPNKPTLAQTALICIYTDRPLNGNNADSIAAEYGYKCGEKLFRHYGDYKTSSARTASGRTEMGKSNKQKGKDIKHAIDFLKAHGCDTKQVEKELRQLEDNINIDLKNSDRF